MKLRTKIILAFSLIAIISVFIIGIAGISIGKKAMEEEAFNKLTSIRELKANRIEAYFEQIRNQLLSFSESYTTIDAMNGFHMAFHSVEKEQLIINGHTVDNSLQNYYLNEFIPHLNANSIDDYHLEDFYLYNFTRSPCSKRSI